MELSEIIAIVAGIVAIVVAYFAWQRSGEPLTVAGAQEGFVSAQSMAAELEKVGLMAVASAQQLKETGAIATNSEAYNHAFDYINRWFPSLDRQIVASAVEGAYKLYKLSAQANKPPTPDAEPLTRWQDDSSALPRG